MGDTRGATNPRTAAAVAVFVLTVGVLLVCIAVNLAAAAERPDVSTVIGPVRSQPQQDEGEQEIGVEVERTDTPTPTTLPTNVGGVVITPIPGPGGSGSGGGGQPASAGGSAALPASAAAPDEPLAETGATSTLFLVALGLLLIDLGYLAVTAAPAHAAVRLRPA